MTDIIETTKVQILRKARGAGHWYSHHIGEIFDAYDKVSTTNQYIISEDFEKQPRDRWRYINREHCVEILPGVFDDELRRYEDGERATKLDIKRLVCSLKITRDDLSGVERERDEARAEVARLQRESVGAFAWWLDGTGGDIESSGVAGRAVYKNAVVAVDAFRAALSEEVPE